MTSLGKPWVESYLLGSFTYLVSFFFSSFFFLSFWVKISSRNGSRLVASPSRRAPCNAACRKSLLSNWTKLGQNRDPGRDPRRGTTSRPQPLHAPEIRSEHPPLAFPVPFPSALLPWPDPARPRFYLTPTWLVIPKTFSMQEKAFFTTQHRPYKPLTMFSEIPQNI